MPLALYYEKHGNRGGPRPPLVLIHGGAGSIATNWEYVTPHWPPIGSSSASSSRVMATPRMPIAPTRSRIPPTTSPHSSVTSTSRASTSWDSAMVGRPCCASPSDTRH